MRKPPVRTGGFFHVDACAADAAAGITAGLQRPATAPPPPPSRRMHRFWPGGAPRRGRRRRPPGRRRSCRCRRRRARGIRGACSRAAVLSGSTFANRTRQELVELGEERAEVRLGRAGSAAEPAQAAPDLEAHRLVGVGEHASGDRAAERVPAVRRDRINQGTQALDLRVARLHLGAFSRLAVEQLDPSVVIDGQECRPCDCFVFAGRFYGSVQHLGGLSTQRPGRRF